jgi:hypothetical protein
MKIDKKKKPNDYPLLSFRVTTEEKSQIQAEIEKVVLMLNKSRSEDARVVRGNHVFVEALKLGLKIIRKNGAV